MAYCSERNSAEAKAERPMSGPAAFKSPQEPPRTGGTAALDHVRYPHPKIRQIFSPAYRAAFQGAALLLGTAHPFPMRLTAENMAQSEEATCHRLPVPD